MVIAALEGKVIIALVIAVGFLAASIVYLPVALVREATRSESEVLPEWMGTVKARRTRMRVILMILGTVAIAFLVVANLQR